MDAHCSFTSPQYDYHQYGDSYQAPALNSTQNKLRRKRNMHRSTSRASKQRRDLINTEIARLRDLLPLPATVKTRLSYLHVMSLACVYIRKGNFFHQQEPDCEEGEWNTEQRTDFTQALHGFLVALTSNGKLLYMSENVTDYLGHSMVELLSTGGGIYDVIDPRDHAVVRAHLEINNSSQMGAERTIFCRMNTSRNMRRRNHCADNKMVRIQGRFMIPNPAAGVYPWSYESIFVGLCSPIDVTMPVPNEMAAYNTSIFVTRHELDMTIRESGESVLFHLGYEAHELDGCSWYGLVHHEDLQAAADFHQRILQSSSNGNSRCVVVLRLLCCDYMDSVPVCITGWLEKESTSSTSTSTSSIICQNQVIRAEEVYMYKSMQSFFESSAKQPSNPSTSTSSNNTSKGQDSTTYGTNWQHDTQHQQHQHQDGTTSMYQENGLSIWNCAQDSSLYIDSCGSISTAPSYSVESLPSCENILTGDTPPVEWTIDATGTMTDVQYQDSPGSEGSDVVKDIKDGCNGELACRYDITEISERLQTFLIWANRWRVKEEYCSEGENGGEEDGIWSRPLSSCLYKTECVQSKPTLCHLMTGQHRSNSDGLVKELSPDALINCDSILGVLPTSSTRCIRVPSDQVLYPTKQSDHIDGNVHTLSELTKTNSSAGNIPSTLLKLSNGKVDGARCLLRKFQPGDVSVGDSLRHAVRQAIGMLSSDQLHLLDEAIMFCAPASRFK